MGRDGDGLRDMYVTMCEDVKRNDAAMAAESEIIV